jgi:hypothetical protein
LLSIHESVHGLMQRLGRKPAPEPSS